MSNIIVDIHTHSKQAEVITSNERGVHPWRAEEIAIKDVDWAELMKDAEAIGEIGLDFACSVDRNKQQQLFEYQLNIAIKKQLPVIIHCVKAFEPTLATLRRYNLKVVIFHGFIGSEQQAQQAINQGYYLSFGERTSRSPKSIEALRATPLDHLFVETDVSSIPIYYIYREIASLKGCTTEQLIESARNNYNKIFETKQK